MVCYLHQPPPSRCPHPPPHPPALPRPICKHTREETRQNPFRVERWRRARLALPPSSPSASLASIEESTRLGRMTCRAEKRQERETERGDNAEGVICGSFGAKGGRTVQVTRRGADAFTTPCPHSQQSESQCRFGRERAGSNRNDAVRVPSSRRECRTQQGKRARRAAEKTGPRLLSSIIKPAVCLPGCGVVTSSKSHPLGLQPSYTGGTAVRFATRPHCLPTTTERTMQIAVEEDIALPSEALGELLQAVDGRMDVPGAPACARRRNNAGQMWSGRPSRQMG